MNVIVSNRQKEIIDNANIDAIKDLNGLFSVNDLINKFKNYFFSRMILDATSVVDFASREVLSTLANEIGPEKLIILLPSTPEPPLEFKKVLIELKIYNFTNNINDVVKFIEKPNTYEDAIKLIDDSYSSDVYVDNSIKEGEGDDAEVNENDSNVANDLNTMNDLNAMNNYNAMNNNAMDDSNGAMNNFNPMNNINPMNNFNQVNNSAPNSQSSLGDILNSLNLNNTTANPQDNDSNSEQENSNDNNISFENNIVSFHNIAPQNEVNINNNEEHVEEAKVDFNNITNNFANVENNNNDNNNVFLINDNFDNTYTDPVEEKPKKLVIGIKGVTTHAGCTSLIYMLHRMIVVNLKKDVLSIEINKNDFRLFRNNKMISVKEEDLSEVINNAVEDIIFIDLNECNNFDICSKVVYLVEPSTIKLNELMATNREIFKELKDKCVILNKSLLSPNDIRTLESEAGMHFFYNITPLNDRIMNDTISQLLNLLVIN